jgi:hypothetical protein
MNSQMNELHGIGIRDTRHNENKHVLTLKGDNDIFDNVFKPLVNECPNDGFDEQPGNPNCGITSRFHFEVFFINVPIFF